MINKILNKIEIEENFFKSIKNVYQKPATTIIPDEKRLNAFQVEKKARMCSLTIFIRHSVRGLSREIKQEKKINIHNMLIV